ncbi:putative zinc-binding peptidase [Tistrella mobilis]|uniref:zinc-binding metallopeptidase family protein n=1 Tax=Tistrella mobilis TaxID=171437 RepID=UPI0031F6E3F1
MKLFSCQNCSQTLFFENTTCLRCGHRLGYLPDATTLSALEPETGGRWRPLAMPDQMFRFCANATHDACNWLIPTSSPHAWCKACRLNRTVPDLAVPANLAAWQRLEVAKHRLIYALLRLGLPVAAKWEDPVGGLAFNFLADVDPEAPRIMTGHAEGLVTINVAEADDAERERIRRDMGEPYRTLLGHFRHEIGHYYWNRLIRDADPSLGRLDRFRAMFGDESCDYAEALARNYAEGPPADWQERFVSTYAASHPWEDFAETWAHYLHIVDTLETAHAFGIRLKPQNILDPAAPSDVAYDFDAYRQRDFAPLIEAWLPLTYAVNSLNRSMGQQDLYPFVLAPAVIDKLRFVHDLIREAG